MSDREKMNAKVQEMKEKYADLINDLAVSNGVTMDVAFYQLVAIPRAIMLGLEPMYQIGIEYNVDELVNDYMEYFGLAKKVLG